MVFILFLWFIFLLEVKAMKQFKTLIFISLVALLVSSPLFASGAVEKGKDFSSIDLATATGSEMEAAWSRSLESYNTSALLSVLPWMKP